MEGEQEPVADGVRRATLAFSALPSVHAESISSRLSAVERMRLRQGLTGTRDASFRERREALGQLVNATRAGVPWETPAVHDAADCPFRCVEGHPWEDVAKTLELIVDRRPLHAAVALCHLDPSTRDQIWSHMSIEARGSVVVVLHEVPSVSSARSCAFARELDAHLNPVVQLDERRPPRVPVMQLISR